MTVRGEGEDRRHGNTRTAADPSSSVNDDLWQVMGDNTMRVLMQANVAPESSTGQAHPKISRDIRREDLNQVAGGGNLHSKVIELNLQLKLYVGGQYSFWTLRKIKKVADVKSHQYVF